VSPEVAAPLSAGFRRASALFCNSLQNSKLPPHIA